jgi:hypothetical protein
MPIKRLSQTSLTSFQKHSNLLAGNPAFNPNDFFLLQTTILNTATSTVTFSGLGSYSQYKHLQLRIVSRRPSGGSFLTAGSWGLQFNGDTGSNYSWHRFAGNGTVVSSDGGGPGAYGPDNVVHGVPNSPTGSFGASVTDILDFSSTSKFKTIRVLAGVSDSAELEIDLNSGSWQSLNAITSITIQERWGQFAANSRFSLYGIR